MKDEVARELRTDFAEAVNMTPDEIGSWLHTEASRSVHTGDGPIDDHNPGHRIAATKRKPVARLTIDDYNHMRMVIEHIHRLLAQRPEGDVTDTPWRHSLMNWGHDPCK